MLLWDTSGAWQAQLLCHLSTKDLPWFVYLGSMLSKLGIANWTHVPILIFTIIPGHCIALLWDGETFTKFEEKCILFFLLSQTGNLEQGRISFQTLPVIDILGWSPWAYFQKGPLPFCLHLRCLKTHPGGGKTPWPLMLASAWSWVL